MSSASSYHAGETATTLIANPAGLGHTQATIAPGTNIGVYVIERFLGEGGMGVVYLARQTNLDRHVVIKFLKPDADLGRFQREARIAARIDHPHVVKILELGEMTGQAFMVLEYVANGDLAAHVGDASLPVERVVGWLRDCLHGLDALHKAGMIHRDLKPQNIFIDASDRAKLGDLGLAKAVRGDDQLTMQGTTGTPAFLSPEQARNLPLDIRTDIYSLGATFYCLLTGQRPFEGSLAEIFHQVLTVEPTRLRHLNPQVPEVLAQVINKAMTKDRDRRYPTPAAMLAALDAAMAGKKSGHQPVWWWAAGAAALAVAGGGAWFFWPAHTVPPVVASPSAAVVSAPAEVGTPPSAFTATGSDARGRWATLASGSGNLRLRLVPAGNAMLGSPEGEERRSTDESLHPFTTGGFWMTEGEVTQAQWQSLLGTNPSRFTGDPARPVERVSWDDAQVFCLRLAERTKLPVRLPTQDEWEYACRAGATTTFASGATLGPDAALFDGSYSYAGSSRSRRPTTTQADGGFPANAWGLVDMHGNVAEWCADVQADGTRPLRGGSWSDPPWNCRSAARFTKDRATRSSEIGFRFVITATP